MKPTVGDPIKVQQMYSTTKTGKQTPKLSNLHHGSEIIFLCHVMCKKKDTDQQSQLSKLCVYLSIRAQLSMTLSAK